MSQLSLFGESAREPALTDLEGLLAGNGQAVRRGDAARLSVIVADGWRVDALVAQLAERLGMEADVARSEAGTTVRTPWLAELRPIADAWTRGAVKAPPSGWSLDGPRLRWWCIASGTATTGLYTLTLGASDEQAWLAVGSALAALGIAGVFVGPRADGPAYRIVGRRRLTRLVELVGQPPPGLPGAGWPAVP